MLSIMIWMRDLIEAIIFIIIFWFIVLQASDREYHRWDWWNPYFFSGSIKGLCTPVEDGRFYLLIWVYQRSSSLSLDWLHWNYRFYWSYIENDRYYIYSEDSTTVVRGMIIFLSWNISYDFYWNVHDA